LARDPRFDGRFIVAVITTGIFCRPICPARTPAEANVRYFPTPASAQDAGYRPCLRCRPESARRLPEWTLGSHTVIRAMRLIDAGFLDERPVAELAAAVNVSTRHLDRLFREQLQTTPKSLAMMRRVQLAKRLIDGSNLAFSKVALQSGYGSVRRFNDEVRSTFGRSPRQLRERRKGGAEEERLVLQLPVREPYNRDWVFGFLEKRALPGIEEVSGLCYRRCLTPQASEPAWLTVRWQDSGLELEVPFSVAGDFAQLLRRVRRIFDLDADPEVIDARIAEDPLLTDLLARHRGLRVPGAWDGFETTVRAILGQQVSVARATELAARLCQQFGGGDFPGAAALEQADIAAIGMPGARAEAIRQLAAGVRSGQLQLDDGADFEALARSLQNIRGIGAWTAGYVGMRVAKNPDAFPESDWVVLKALTATPAAARRHARQWQPWRAYGVMYLWKMAELARQAGSWPPAAAHSNRS
jgi:AraC family transcriptional regulator of adaptative response / DNA-3-methyladenine glycosylase II